MVQGHKQEPVVSPTVNFVVKNCPRTLAGILSYNFPAKTLTILQNKYENVLTYTQSENMDDTQNVVTFGKIENIPTIIYTNEKIQDPFADLSSVFKLTFDFSNFYFISEYSLLLKDNCIQQLITAHTESCVGFAYSDYIQKSNVIFCDEDYHDFKAVLIKKEIVAQYKLKQINPTLIKSHIGLHIPEPLFEVLNPDDHNANSAK